MKRLRKSSGPRGGFTLAEVAVTLVIVGIGLVYVLQGLSQAKLVSYYTVNKKIARQLAAGTLGEVEAGMFWEEVEPGGDRLTGTYAEEGYESFGYEILFGEEEEFSEGRARTRSYGGFDSWSRTRDSDRDGIPDDEELDSTRDDGEETDPDEVVEEPYEIVRIRVNFPTVALENARSEVVLERWIPWEQVYGKDEDEETAAEGDAGGTPPVEGGS